MIVDRAKLPLINYIQKQRLETSWRHMQLFFLEKYVHI